jgi:hypothetical protein
MNQASGIAEQEGIASLNSHFSTAQGHRMPTEFAHFIASQVE